MGAGLGPCSLRPRGRVTWVLHARRCVHPSPVPSLPAPRRLPAMAMDKALSPSEPLSSASPRKCCWCSGRHLRRPWREL